MRKQIFSVLLTAFLSLSFIPVANAAGAATFNFSASKSTYVVGEHVVIYGNVNPNGESIIVSRANFTYPENLLEPISFNKGGLYEQRSPASQVSGGNGFVGAYNLNEGTTSSGTAVVMTFRAKAPGVANIQLKGGSHLINENQEERINLGGSSGVSVTIVPPGATPAPSTPSEPAEPTHEGLALSSETHPDQAAWYNDPQAEICWNALSEVTGYSMFLSEVPNQDPGFGVNTEETCFNFVNSSQEIGEGFWYFSARPIYESGTAPVANFGVQLDMTPPNEFPVSFEISVDNENDKNYQLFFITDDNLSGIDKYTLRLSEDGEEKAIESPYQMGADELTAEKLYVNAYDKAGNVTTTVLDMTDNFIQAQLDAGFYPAGTLRAPTIDPKVSFANISKVLYQQKALHFSGTAIPSSQVNLFFSHDPETAKATTASNEGLWDYSLTDNLGNGTHTVYAVSVIGEDISPQSNLLQFTLQQDFVSQIALNYILLAIILLLIFLLFFFKRGKKEKKSIKKAKTKPKSKKK